MSRHARNPSSSRACHTSARFSRASPRRGLMTVCKRMGVYRGVRPSEGRVVIERAIVIANLSQAYHLRGFDRAEDGLVLRPRIAICFRGTAQNAFGRSPRAEQSGRVKGNAFNTG